MNAPKGMLAMLPLSFVCGLLIVTGLVLLPAVPPAYSSIYTAIVADGVAGLAIIGAIWVIFLVNQIASAKFYRELLHSHENRSAIPATSRIIQIRALVSGLVTIGYLTLAVPILLLGSASITYNWNKVGVLTTSPVSSAWSEYFCFFADQATGGLLLNVFDSAGATLCGQSNINAKAYPAFAIFLATYRAVFSVVVVGSIVKILQYRQITIIILDFYDWKKRMSDVEKMRLEERKRRQNKPR